MRNISILLLACSVMALAGLPARAVNYTLIGPPGGSFKSVEYLRDGALLAGSFDGRLFLSLNRGDNWTDITPGPLTRGMFVEQIVRHTLTDSVYIIVRDLKRGLLLKDSITDIMDGMNHSQVIFPDVPIRSLALSKTDPPRIFVGTDERLHYSFDGGATWKAAATQMRNPEVESLAIDPDDPDALYAGSWQRAYKTVDFGTTWSPIHTGMAPDSDVFALVFDSVGNLWAGTCGHAYRSADRGALWQKKNIGLKGKRIHCLELSTNGGDGDILAGTDNGLHIFREPADAWMQIIPDVVVQDITRDESGCLYVATEGLGILRHRLDPPETLPVNAGLDASSPKSIAGSPDGALWTGLVYQGSHSGLWRYGNLVWHKVSVECDGANIRDLIVTGAYLFAATANGIFRLDLDPVTGIETGEARRFLDGMTIKTLHLEPDGVTLVAGGFDGIYAVNTDTGDFAPYPGMKNININTVWKCRSTGLMLAGSDTGLWRKEPRTAIWRPLALPMKTLSINKIVGTGDAKHIYLATSVGALVSHDGGTRFARCNGTLPAAPCLDAGLRGNDIYLLMGDRSIYHRKLADFKWKKVITLPFDAWSMQVVPDSDTICIGTPAKGVVVIEN